MSPTQAPCTNQLILSLPRQDGTEFLRRCETVDLAFAQILAQAGSLQSHVYFPASGFISLIAAAEPHSTLEVALIGTEGMLGAPLALGLEIAPLRAIVQGAGSALRMEGVAFRRQLEQSEALRSCMRRYVGVMLAQFAQTAVCTRFHLLEERLARWLMMTRDRAHGDRFHLTHVFLASMLGVRRVGVTEAATALQRRGLISYNRGDITILDSHGLERACCRCYGADLESYATTMGSRPAGDPAGPPASTLAPQR